MIEIIPAILEKDFNEIQNKLKIIEPYVLWAQIDVVDGVFAPNTTWNDPITLARFTTSLKLEIDLMVAEPEKHIDAWVASGASRIFFHAEAAQNPTEMIKNVRAVGIEIGMSINPATPIDVLFEYAPELNAVLFLGVEPGFQGQTFHEEVIEKVRAMRAKFSSLAIEVDGGVRIGVAKKLARAGATRLAVGNAIFGDGELAVHKNIEDLIHDTHYMEDET